MIAQDERRDHPYLELKNSTPGNPYKPHSINASKHNGHKTGLTPYFTDTA